ncbi:MAG: cupredoxin domain-containing protein [Chloroflexota bacterium]|nr:cupredoxin domain-containing protein [Dehalococcoidia bacterium]MDW8047320.1 cupredoxin domain-containing protein [Chloroflexota bacterium]
MPKRLRRMLSGGGIALLGAVLLAACSSATSDPQAVPTTAEGYPIVNQDRLRFIPKRLTIPAGMSVLFRNSETAIHDVLVDGVNVSGNMRKGDEVLYTFESPGTFAITCSFHPQMRATIVVVPPAEFTPPSTPNN